jgi:hypothetical protein
MLKLLLSYVLSSSLLYASEFTEIDIVPARLKPMKEGEGRPQNYDGLITRFQRMKPGKPIPIWQCQITFMPFIIDDSLIGKKSRVKMEYYIDADYYNLEREKFREKFPNEDLSSDILTFSRTQIPNNKGHGHLVRWIKNDIEHLVDIIAVINTFQKPDKSFPYYKLTGSSFFYEAYNCCTFSVALLHRLKIDFSRISYFSANIDYKNASYWSCTQIAKAQRVIDHIKQNKYSLKCEIHQINYDIQFKN